MRWCNYKREPGTCVTVTLHNNERHRSSVRANDPRKSRLYGSTTKLGAWLRGHKVQLSTDPTSITEVTLRLYIVEPRLDFLDQHAI